MLVQNVSNLCTGDPVRETKAIRSSYMLGKPDVDLRERVTHDPVVFLNGFFVACNAAALQRMRSVSTDSSGRHLQPHGIQPRSTLATMQLGDVFREL